MIVIALQILCVLCGLGMLVAIALVPEGPLAKASLAVMAVCVMFTIATALSAVRASEQDRGPAVIADEDGEMQMVTDDVVTVPE